MKQGHTQDFSLGMYYVCRYKRIGQVNNDYGYMKQGHIQDFSLGMYASIKEQAR